ncbi:cytosolic 5'-nucleotidase 1A-like isoform X1 [Leucoraja erinacea]|uniref:cytosolic 5'-nucleotidase 1A-like isoform X1 n=1 Tax=Leucoraja erinaceus TaxID=7782 RepID=UPI002454AA08|nr:cytosolic 5'-nucleotidase 1A-like isoform X1 [Leucoraja erinacea]
MSDTGLYSLDDMDICSVPVPAPPERASATRRSRGSSGSTKSTSGNKLPNAITIAVSSRTLFNMAEERAIYETDGLESYVKFQQEHENEPLKKGLAFALMKALEAVNLRLHELYPGSDEVFDVVLMTNNHAQVGVRLINSINHYGLSIDRFCLTGGTSPISYLKAYQTNLYLSSDPVKVAKALSEGIAAATLCHLDKDAQLSEQQLRVAFDGDSFVTQESNEKPSKNYLMVDSPSDYESMQQTGRGGAPEPGKSQFAGFIEILGKIQRKIVAENEHLECPLRTYLITGRSPASSIGRVLKIISDNGLQINETLYLAGSPKKPILDIIRPHIYFGFLPTAQQQLDNCSKSYLNVSQFRRH